MLEVNRFKLGCQEPMIVTPCYIGYVLRNIAIKNCVIYYSLRRAIILLLDDVASYDMVRLDSLKCIIRVKSNDVYEESVINDGNIIIGSYKIDRFKWAMVLLSYVLTDSALLDKWIDKNLTKEEITYGKHMVDDIILSDNNNDYTINFLTKINSLKSSDIVGRCKSNEYKKLFIAERLLKDSDMTCLNNIKDEVDHALYAITNTKPETQYHTVSKYGHMIALLLLTDFGLDRVVTIKYIAMGHDSTVTRYLLDIEKSINKGIKR